MNPNDELNRPTEPSPADEAILAHEQPPAGEHLSELEAYLAQALRPADPPANFTESILARAASAPQVRAKILRMPSRTRIWTGSAVAASLVAGILIAGAVRARHERQKIERAEHQFNTALQITNEALDQTREELRQAGIETDNRSSE